MEKSEARKVLRNFMKKRGFRDIFDSFESNSSFIYIIGKRNEKWFLKIHKDRKKSEKQIKREKRISKSLNKCPDVRTPEIIEHDQRNRYTLYEFIDGMSFIELTRKVRDSSGHFSYLKKIAKGVAYIHRSRTGNKPEFRDKFESKYAEYLEKNIREEDIRLTHQDLNHNNILFDNGDIILLDPRQGEKGSKFRNTIYADLAPVVYLIHILIPLKSLIGSLNPLRRTSVNLWTSRKNAKEVFLREYEKNAGRKVDRDLLPFYLYARVDTMINVYKKEEDRPGLETPVSNHLLRRFYSQIMIAGLKFQKYRLRRKMDKIIEKDRRAK